MARMRKVAAIAALSSAVLFGGVACGGSSTVSAPTTPIVVGSEGPTSLPATAAPSSAAAPSGFPGSRTVTESPAEAKFVSDLRAKGFTDDENTLIQAGRYVCAALSTKPTPKSYEIMVEAIVGKDRTPDEAKKAAATVIDTAKSGMCKK